MVQLTLSAYLLMLGLGQLVFGPLSDRIGRRPVVLGGSVAYAVASFALALSSDGEAFLVFRVIQAIGASAALVVSGMGTLATVVFGGGTAWALVGFCGVMCGVNAAGLLWLARQRGT